MEASDERRSAERRACAWAAAAEIDDEEDDDDDDKDGPAVTLVAPGAFAATDARPLAAPAGGPAPALLAAATLVRFFPLVRYSRKSTVADAPVSDCSVTVEKMEKEDSYLRAEAKRRPS